MKLHLNIDYCFYYFEVCYKTECEQTSQLQQIKLSVQIK